VALVFALEPVFAGLAGYLLAGHRLGTVGWAGCALILAGIAVSEPGAAAALQRSGRGVDQLRAPPDCGGV
jgi:drug/metabolite transporter (DMT)-like permease